MRQKLYSYIVAKDYGLAPNPYWGRLTLTVCKPDIRKFAKIGDWIIGTGSKNVHRPNKIYTDYSSKLVYAMKVSVVMSLREYDAYCMTDKSEMKNKIPKKSTDKKLLVGDCIYKYPINGDYPILRDSLHSYEDMPVDLSGENSLISDEFYYFGENACKIDTKFNSLIKNGIGYLMSEDDTLITEFIQWLNSLGFEKNKVLGNPQLGDLIIDRFNNNGKSECIKHQVRTK